MQFILSLLSTIFKIPIFLYGAYWIVLIILGATHLYTNGVSDSPNSIEFLLGLGAFLLIYGILFVLPNRIILKNKKATIIYIGFMIPPILFLWTTAYYGFQQFNQLGDYVSQLSQQQMRLGGLGLSIPYIIAIISLLLAGASNKIKASSIPTKPNEEIRVEPTI